MTAYSISRPAQMTCELGSKSCDTKLCARVASTTIGRHNHIPRPPNAFFLFRSEYIRSQYISTEVETDHSTLSKIIGLTWRNLPEEEREKWRGLAQDELDEHKRRFPGYVFRPCMRPKDSVSERRKMREVKPKDQRRCEKIAELLASGKTGGELESAIQEFDKYHVPEITTRFDTPITANTFESKMQQMRPTSPVVPDSNFPDVFQTNEGPPCLIGRTESQSNDSEEITTQNVCAFDTQSLDNLMLESSQYYDTVSFPDNVTYPPTIELVSFPDNVTYPPTIELSHDTMGNVTYSPTIELSRDTIDYSEDTYATQQENSSFHLWPFQEESGVGSGLPLVDPGLICDVSTTPLQCCPPFTHRQGFHFSNNQNPYQQSDVFPPAAPPDIGFLCPLQSSSPSARFWELYRQGFYFANNQNPCQQQYPLQFCSYFAQFWDLYCQGLYLNEYPYHFDFAMNINPNPTLCQGDSALRL